MSSDSPSSTDPTAAAAPPSDHPAQANPADPSATCWGGALLVGIFAAWLLFNFAPRVPYPEHLMSVDIYSPQELQIEAEETSLELYWKNSLIRFSLAGLCLGAVPLFLAGGSNRRPHPGQIFLWLGVGILSGVAAALAGIGVRWFFNKDAPLPMIDESIRPLVGDMVVFIVISVFLVLPIAFWMLGGGPEQRQRAMAVPLAAVLAGLLLPIVASFLIPTVATDEFPPRGLGVTALWFALLGLLVFGLPRLTGSRRKKSAAPAAPAES